MDEIEERLNAPLQAVLSVSRKTRGPVAVPMSYLFDRPVFRMITSPGSVHGRLMREGGRATLTIQEEVRGERRVEQWYVMAEGPVEFIDEDPTDLLRAILTKDRGARFASEWVAQSLPNVTTVAVLTPKTLSGYRGLSSLD